MPLTGMGPYVQQAHFAYALLLDGLPKVDPLSTSEHPL